MIKYEQVQSFEDVLDVFTSLKEEFFSFDGDLAEFCVKIYNNGICVICEDNGVCGVVAFYANDTINYTAYITSVLVSKSARGKGIGTNLVKLAESISRDRKMTKIRLEVNVDNIAAKSLYEKLGYLEVQKKENSIYLEKRLHT